MAALKTKLSLDATTLKIIAIVLMVFDHIHQMFAPAGAPIWLTWLGRPVMIMFLFAMSESFHYTRSRGKYLSRLWLGSCFMTVFSVILETLILPNDNVVLMNNAFSTFLVAGLYMLFWDMLLDGIKRKKAGKNTHVISSLYEAFPAAKARGLAKRIEMHHTPKHGSRLNAAKIVISILSKQCLCRRVLDLDTLNHELTAWNRSRCFSQKPVDWQFSTTDARIKLKHLYPSV